MSVAERFTGANVIDAGRLSPYWGEHAARYFFALPYVCEKTVLDIACGTGYGLGIMQTSAAKLVGLDVNIDAARAARSECDQRVGVLLGDGLRLPFSDNCFDVVTSFETLEHLRDRSEFLTELRRVLRSSGRLVLSTPNANYTKPANGRPSNPFHIFEYKPSELRAELEACFRVEILLGQDLDASIRIPPFHEAQVRLPKDLGTRVRLFGWKVLNKMPLSFREKFSEAVWRRPFYPTDHDYRFSPETIETAPVLLAVCSGK